MDNEQKKKEIEDYIMSVSSRVNSQYNGLIDDDKIARAKEMFKDSDEDLETKIIPKINELVQEVIDNYLDFKKQIDIFINANNQEQYNELATLDFYNDKNGLFLSQQQIDLLMITEVESKEELKDYIENQCSQFPYKSVLDIIENYDSISTVEELDKAKRLLYKKYQESIIDYLSYSQMNDIEKAQIKLEKIGIKDRELQMCLQQVENGNTKEAFTYLEQKYGRDFITKFNHLMNCDFDNVRSVSYDEMESLSALIKRDKSIDTIVTTSGTFNNSFSGNFFDPYLTNKAIKYCAGHDIHLRYHALFDQSHVEQLLKQGKGINNHDEILSQMKSFVETTMQYIEKNNRPLSDGSMVINEVEIFNELVEKNKKEKNSSYQMVWEKYFGITTEEIASCFEGVQKPSGVEFMYNETTLTESPYKRQSVEIVMKKLLKANPNLIDIFGDQMHLSDEDVMTSSGKKNLEETSQLLKKIQDMKIYVDGKEKRIKTECSEHDFHFSKQFFENSEKLNNIDKAIDMWQVKKSMQNYISKTYTANGVDFGRTTYWSLFGSNDHNLVRANKSIARENQDRQKQGKFQKKLLDTMCAGLIKDGSTFKNINSLKSIKQSNVKISSVSKEYFNKRSKTEVEIARQIKQKNSLIKKQKLQTKELNKPKVKKLNLSTNKSTGGNRGFVLLGLIICILVIGLFMIIYLIMKK